MRRSTVQTVERFASRKGAPRTSTRSPLVKKESPMTGRLFYHDPLFESYEYIVPMATVLCEPAWKQVRALIEATTNRPISLRKAIAIHPATLIILRTPGMPSEKTFSKLKRQMLKETLGDIEDRKVVLLNNLAFPQAGPFHDCAIYDVLAGGEGYRLSWGEGLQDGINDEFGEHEVEGKKYQS